MKEAVLCSLFLTTTVIKSIKCFLSIALFLRLPRFAENCLERMLWLHEISLAPQFNWLIAQGRVDLVQ